MPFNFSILLDHQARTTYAKCSQELKTSEIIVVDSNMSTRGRSQGRGCGGGGHGRGNGNMTGQ